MSHLLKHGRKVEIFRLSVKFRINQSKIFSRKKVKSYSLVEFRSTVLYCILYSVYLNYRSAYDDEIEQIKSTHRLPLNTAGEPAHIPSHYDVRIDMGGLKEEDKNEEGYFEYSGHSNINFNWNTESNFIVLHAGAIPGYEVVSAEVSVGSFEEDGPSLKASFEHYKEKEMLIIHVDEENFSGEIGSQYNIRVQFKNWLAKSNTGLYESSYLDEVRFFAAIASCKSK